MSERQIKVKEEESLYSTLKRLYEKTQPCSRIILMFKITQVIDPNARKRDKEKEKALNKDTNTNFLRELKLNLQSLTAQSNVMLIFVGTIYAFVGIENNTENIMQLLRIYKKGTKMVQSVSVIHYNEECPSFNFPIFYKYEGEVYDKESNIYKDVTPSEKAWLLYDNFFCNLGRNLRKMIYSEKDFETKGKQIVQEENNFVKYLPTSNEIEVFEGEMFMNINEFFETYLEEPEAEFDSDLVYPYYWPINI